LENCFFKLNGNLNKIKKSATKIITVLPDNSLTPIPVKERQSVGGVAGIFDKKQYQNAERTAVFIRRMEYSSGVQKHLKHMRRNDDDIIRKIIIIQEWWKTMYKIIRLQKCIRGFLFRRKLMKNLEHQEKLLQFITEFDNIHGYHLYKKFFNNLKKMVNQINSKRNEMLEEFSEKMEKLEHLNNLKKLKQRLLDWKKIVEEEKKLDKARQFYEFKIQNKIMMSLKRRHRFTKQIIKLVKKNYDKEKKIFLDKLYKFKIKTDNDFIKGINKLNEVINKKVKKETFNKLKMLNFMSKLNDIKDKLNDKNKKEFIKRLKQLYDFYIKKDSFLEWRSIIKKKKIFKKLLKLKRKELNSKNKFTVDSNINNLNIIDDNNGLQNKKSDENSISNENSINILKKESPKQLLSVGNAGVDFSIIAPKIFNINDLTNPSKKMIKGNNLNDIFEQTEKIKSLINNFRLKKCFNNWKNKLYLKKIIKLIKEDRNGNNNLDKAKEKLFGIIKRECILDRIKNILKSGKKKDMLEEAFKIWKELNLSLSEKKNYKKLKIKLIKRRDNEKDKFCVCSFVNNLKVIGERRNNKRNKTFHLPLKESYDNDSNKKDDYLLDSDINKEDNNIKDDLSTSKNMICHNALFSLEKAYSYNDESFEKEDNNEIYEKYNNKKEKKEPRILYIQKDNRFSIINKRYINNLSENDKNDINKDILNNKNNGKLYDLKKLEKYLDHIDKINEINEYFPKEEEDEDIIFIYQRTDNFILGKNISDFNDKENDNIFEGDDNKYKFDLAKLAKRKIVPFKNLEICPMELFSIICEYKKDEDKNKNNSKNVKDKDEILENNTLNNNDNDRKINDSNDNDDNNDIDNKDNKNGKIIPKDENDDLLDENYYKLYHSDNFCILPQNYEDIHYEENKSESDKIIDLPLLKVNKEMNELIKRIKKDFNNMNIIKVHSFIIFGNKNKINENNKESLINNFNDHKYKDNNIQNKNNEKERDLSFNKAAKLEKGKINKIINQFEDINTKIKTIKPELYNERGNKMIDLYKKNKNNNKNEEKDKSPQKTKDNKNEDSFNEEDKKRNEDNIFENNKKSKELKDERNKIKGDNIYKNKEESENNEDKFDSINNEKSDTNLKNKDKDNNLKNKDKDTNVKDKDNNFNIKDKDNNLNNKDKDTNLKNKDKDNNLNNERKDNNLNNERKDNNLNNNNKDNNLNNNDKLYDTKNNLDMMIRNKRNDINKSEDKDDLRDENNIIKNEESNLYDKNKDDNERKDNDDNNNLDKLKNKNEILINNKIIYDKLKEKNNNEENEIEENKKLNEDNENKKIINNNENEIYNENKTNLNNDNKISDNNISDDNELDKNKNYLNQSQNIKNDKLNKDNNNNENLINNNGSDNKINNFENNIYEKNKNLIDNLNKDSNENKDSRGNKDNNNEKKEIFNEGLDEKLNNENNYNNKRKVVNNSLFKINQNNDNMNNSSYSKNEKSFENANEDKNVINNYNGKAPQYSIFSTEKIDLMFNPQLTNKKKIENKIVKENDLKIFNIGDKNNLNSKFSLDKNKIEQFNVLIKPENNKEIDLNKIEKSDFENQTLEDEYLISKQSKNIFTINSIPNKNNLSFNKEKIQYDSTNSFSIKVIKKKINKNDLNKGINNVKKLIRRKILNDLISSANEMINYNRIQSLLQNLLNKKNKIILKKYFYKWNNNIHSKKELILKKIINNLQQKSLKLHKILEDLDNNNKDKNNEILKHYLNKWKNNTFNERENKKHKRRISMRKNIKTKKSYLNLLKKKEKQKKEKHQIIDNYFKKWKNISLNYEELSRSKILNKLIKFKRKKEEEEIKNNNLINKLKKAILQSLFRLYKQKNNKILKKYLSKWLKVEKINNKRYIKKFFSGKNTNSQEKLNLSNIYNNNNNLSSFNSNFDFNSPNNTKYYPKKVGKYNIKEKDTLKLNSNNSQNTYNNNNNKDYLLDKRNIYFSPNKISNTYNGNENQIKNISFGQQILPHDQNIIPSKILEKIKNRTEKYSQEFQNSMTSDYSDPNFHKKNVSMIQRIKRIYRSPNSSMNSNNINNTNYNVNTNKSNKDIFGAENYLIMKKNKKMKNQKKNIKNKRKEIEDKKEQNSNDSSLNNLIMGGGINLMETKIENLKPIIYTSQSFFIDKKTNNLVASENPNISYYRNITNKCPMKMKGDFTKLIKENPDILNQKNPRIQVTNATCELEQFEERESFNINNKKRKEIKDKKLKNKNKELTEVVLNCDKDIYESQIPYETQKQKWISMSIPLKNDVAKWKFLNSVKGERYKNNTNKFELIQQKKKRHMKLVESQKGLSSKSNSLSKITEEDISNNIQYKLSEMNYTQFYRSPIKKNEKKDEKNSISPPTVKLIKKERAKKNKNTHRPRIFSADCNTRISYDIEEMSEQSESYE